MIIKYRKTKKIVKFFHDSLWQFSCENISPKTRSFVFRNISTPVGIMVSSGIRIPVFGTNPDPLR